MGFTDALRFFCGHVWIETDMKRLYRTSHHMIKI